ncbi:hypothetical protein BDV23DRAFT_189403 [Aspergillus alliaceus]|uniref:DUF7492 domain-containing protein n=1 Tax=Petromyces alliaceus TaxID=209559 RepID=A0A5N7BRH9_PETAA|nr:hypothetical protein BDV23DRAFT_189403 [Aspergillus alliaceus]
MGLSIGTGHHVQVSAKLSLGDILGNSKKKLAVYSHPSILNDQCPDSFRLPHNVEPASVYTIYWMWNTTQTAEGGLGFLLYTLCFDIDIIGPTQAESPSYDSKSQLLETGWSLSTSDNRQTALGVSSPSEHPLSLQTARPPSPCLGEPKTESGSSVVFSSEVSRQNSSASMASSQPGLRLSSSGRTETGTPTRFTGVSPSVPRPTPISSSSLSPIEITSVPSRSTSSPTPSRPSTQMVSVSIGEVIEFTPQSLDASVGDTVWFYTVNGTFGTFAIYNTTLNKPCIPLTRFGDDGHLYVLTRVNSTEPMWFLGIRNQELPRCYPPAHFALNPGSQWEPEYTTLSEDELTEFTRGYLGIIAKSRHIDPTQLAEVLHRLRSVGVAQSWTVSSDEGIMKSSFPSIEALSDATSMRDTCHAYSQNIGSPEIGYIPVGRGGRTWKRTGGAKSQAVDDRGDKPGCMANVGIGQAAAQICPGPNGSAPRHGSSPIDSHRKRRRTTGPDPLQAPVTQPGGTEEPEEGGLHADYSAFTTIPADALTSFPEACPLTNTLCLRNRELSRVFSLSARLIVSDPGAVLRPLLASWQENVARGAHALGLPLKRKGVDGAGAYARFLRNNAGRDGEPLQTNERILPLAVQREAVSPIIDCIARASLEDTSKNPSQGDRDAVLHFLMQGKRLWALISQVGMGLVLACSDELTSAINNANICNGAVDAVAARAASSRPGVLRLLSSMKPMVMALMSGRLHSELFDAVKDDESGILGLSNLRRINQEDHTLLPAPQDTLFFCYLRDGYKYNRPERSITSRDIRVTFNIRDPIENTETTPLWKDLKKLVESDGHQKLQSRYSFFMEGKTKTVGSPEIISLGGPVFTSNEIGPVLALNPAPFEERLQFIFQETEDSGWSVATVEGDMNYANHTTIVSAFQVLRAAFEKNYEKTHPLLSIGAFCSAGLHHMYRSYPGIYPIGR